MRVAEIIEGIKDSPQFIENPNSSGQGRHPEYDHHPFHDVLTQHQYRYSHSTPIRTTDGGYSVHHTYRNMDLRDNVVGVRNGRWEAGKLGQTRRTRGSRPEELDRFLRGHVRRATARSIKGGEADA